MVFDAAMIVSTIVTFTMNGMCCAYQMQEDEDFRRTIRKDLRVEYERQRLIDLEWWAEHDSKVLQYQSESSLSQDRRQRLLRQKMDLSNQTKREGGLQKREEAPGLSDWSRLSDIAVVFSQDQGGCIATSKVTLKQPRSVASSKFAQRRLAQKLTAAHAASSYMSSLLDSDYEDNIFDDIADDDSSFVDVDLR